MFVHLAYFRRNQWKDTCVDRALKCNARQCLAMYELYRRGIEVEVSLRLCFAEGTTAEGAINPLSIQIEAVGKERFPRGSLGAKEGYLINTINHLIKIQRKGSGRGGEIRERGKTRGLIKTSEGKIEEIHRTGLFLGG